jgi:hypothetical protein
MLMKQIIKKHRNPNPKLNQHARYFITDFNFVVRQKIFPDRNYANYFFSLQFFYLIIS